MPNAFIQKRRQKFMTKDYYEKMKEYYDDVVDYSIQDQNHYVDEFNFLSVDLQPDWIILFDVYYGQLLLAYTAGDDIKTLIPYLYKCIECKENEAAAIAKHHYDEGSLPSVLGSNSDKVLQFISLAYLLDCRDLLPKIKLLAEGQNQDVFDATDAMTDRLFRISGLVQEVRAGNVDGGLYNNPWYTIICDCLDDLYHNTGNTQKIKDAIIDELRQNLEEWYEYHNDKLWHNSHLRMEDEYGYFGYWEFVPACLVYLFDLDDTPLHKFIHYPKDLVAWARQNSPKPTPTTPPKYDETCIIQEGQPATVSGYYQDRMTKKIIYLNIGDVSPIYPTPSHLSKSQAYVWCKLTEHGISLIPEEILANAKK
ncbi:Domain of uncharacterised function (DUF1911) [Moraxella lacunata]|uniref:Domain of uncharacterized function (DUF1911) n=1 Tax=Moraxella lacunata TaxID=477 RepID=A0A378TPD5_MORLA|nr:PoNe immunity protein domain-containing protein [Moraxella lacunata]STZ62725.1 Domain of uncharacterised function (DUF1911) [Moraxella lacunata]